ncbi:MAG TPA: glycosyltransferase 87 family protein [Chloroflexota bacterium]|nr:glycosyltransferase 87 family protein [Chloroflexota bacterium]
MAQYSLAAALAAAATVLAHRYVAQRGGDTDFFPRWYALRALLIEGRDPYSASVTAEVALRTSLATAPDAVRAAYGLIYPLPGVLPLAPLVTLPYDWAAGAWLVSGIVALAVAGTLMAATGAARAASSSAPPPLAGAVVVLLSVPALWNAALVQPGLLVPLLVALALWIRSRYPVLAGVALALGSLLKPQLTALVTLGWVGREVVLAVRCEASARRFLAGLTGVVVGLALLATALLPSWPAAFLNAMQTYGNAGALRTTAPAVFVLLAEGAAAPLALLGTVALGLVLLVWVAAGWRAGLLQGAMRSVVVGALLTPPAWETNATPLMLPLAHAAGAARRPWRLVGASVALSAALAPLAVLWPWRSGAVVAVGYAALAVLAAHPRSGWALSLRAKARDRSSAAPDAAARSAPAGRAPR